MTDSTANLTNLLLQDAQQEIASLRSELFNYRQVSEQRRQQCETLAAEKAQFQQALEATQSKLSAAEQQLQNLSRLHSHAKELEHRLSKAQSDLSQSQQQHADLQKTLDQERSERSAVEDANARLDSERSKLQKSRDELAAQVRLAQQKARDAEEEQLRAEDEAAGLRAELRNHSHSTGESNGYSTPNYSAQSELLRELESERLRTATLYNTLTATKADLQRCNQLLEEAQQGQGPNTQQLQEANTQLQNDLQDTKRRLHNTETELASCVAKINRLQQQQQQQQQQAQAEGSPTVTPQSSPRTSQTLPSVSVVDATSTSSQITTPVQDPSMRPSSSGSIQMADTADLMSQAEEARKLGKKVASLKAARDKLLIELDKQVIEAERLGIENKALSSQLHNLQQQCTAWENQAQAALAQVDKLKDIIEESADWSSGGVEATGGGTAPSQDVLRQVARSTELELQVRALCAEVGKARGGATAVGRSLLPILQGVELKLAQLRAGGEAVASVR